MEMIVEDSIIYNITENVTQAAVVQFFSGNIVPNGDYNISMLINLSSLILLNTIIFSKDLFPLNSWYNIPCNNISCNNISYIDLPQNSTYFGVMLIRKNKQAPPLEIMSKTISSGKRRTVLCNPRINSFRRCSLGKRLRRSTNNMPSKWRFRIQFK